MKLDYDQSRAVNARGHTVVSAGAGSGKTTVLTRRYLSLLEEGIDVSQILTLTFTRKAAAEMHQRIYRALAERAEEHPQWTRAFRRFDEARISTLDSFTAEIARAGAAQFGIPPTFSSDEDELERLCMQVATEFLLRHRDHPMLCRLAAERGAEQLLEEGFKELAVREMSPVRPNDFNAMIDRQIRDADELVKRTVAELEEILTFLRTEIDPNMGKVARSITAHAAQTPSLDGLTGAELLQAAQWIAEERAPGSSKSDEARALKENFLEARERFSRLQECMVLLDAEEDLRELYALLERFQDRVLSRKRSSAQLSFDDVMELAIAVLEHVEPVRRWYSSRISHIMIDEFQDNNDRQKYLLELLSGTRSDESVRQGELFYVGDEKQSIYRFRGADVSVFKRLAGELGRQGGNNIALRTNYRSAPRLIGRFNGVFSQLLEGNADYEARFEPLFDRSNAPSGPDAQPPVDDAAAQLEPRDGVAHRSGPALEGDTAHPQFRVFVRRRGGSEQGSGAGHAGHAGQDAHTADPGQASGAGRGAHAAHPGQDAHAGDAGEAGDAAHAGQDESALLTDSETEALFVVETIYNSVCAGNLLVDDEDGGERPAGYEDIAILMRSGANQYEYERMFRRYGIPYHSDSIRSLYLEAPANDMYSLLQVCLYPDDRYAWLTVLRSPLVSLADDAIVRIVQADIPVAAPLPDEVARVIHAEDTRRYASACELYESLCERADRDSIANLLHTIWYDFGYRNLYLCDPVNHGYLEYYDFLCAQAALYEQDGLAAFLDAVRPQLGHFEKAGELTVLGRETEGVRIMSVHRSKGLEFPVVFVVGCGSTGRGGRDAAGIWHKHREYGVTFNLKPEPGRESGNKRSSSNIFLTQAREQEAAEEAAELRRLLYVAVTRARSHCVLTGVWKQPAKASDSPPKSFHELVSPLFSAELPVEWIGDRTVEQRRRAGVRVAAPDPGEMDAVYARAETVHYPMDPGPYTPTGLNDLFCDFHAFPDGVLLPEFGCEDALDRVGAHAAFGSLAHWCAAAYLEGTLDADTDGGTVVSRVPRRLIIALPDEALQSVAREALLRACAAVDALVSAVGGGVQGPSTQRIAQGPSTQRISVSGAHCELPFGMMVSDGGTDVEVHGAIDLVLETDHGPVVADFKTDRVLAPERYRMQLDLYRRAASELFAGEPRAVLVSMRDYSVHEMKPLDPTAYGHVVSQN